MHFYFFPTEINFLMSSENLRKIQNMLQMINNIHDYFYGVLRCYILFCETLILMKKNGGNNVFRMKIKENKIKFMDLDAHDKKIHFRVFSFNRYHI